MKKTNSPKSPLQMAIVFFILLFVVVTAIILFTYFKWFASEDLGAPAAVNVVGEEEIVSEKPDYLVDDGSLTDCFLYKKSIFSKGYGGEQGFYTDIMDSDIKKMIILKKFGFFDNKIDILDQKYIVLKILPRAIIVDSYDLAKDLRDSFIDDTFFEVLHDNKDEYEYYKKDILWALDYMLVYRFETLNSMDKLEDFLDDFLPTENINFLKNHILNTTIPNSFKMEKRGRSKYAMAAPIMNLFPDVDGNFFLSLDENGAYLDILNNLDQFVTDGVLGDAEGRNRLKLGTESNVLYKMMVLDTVENLEIMENLISSIFPDEEIDYSSLLKESLEMGLVNVPLYIIESDKIEIVNDDIYQQAFLRNFERTIYGYKDKNSNNIIKLAGYVLEGMDSAILLNLLNGFLLEKDGIFLFNRINAFYNIKLVLGDGFYNEATEKELLVYFMELVSSDFWKDKPTAKIMLDIYENYFSVEAKNKIAKEYTEELKDKMARLLDANGGGMDGSYLLSEVAVLKSFLDKILSNEEINELAYNGIYSRLSKNYLGDSIKVLKVFFPDKFVGDTYACKEDNLLYLQNGLAENEYCVKDIQLSEAVNSLALQKFEEFLSNGWISDSYRIYHYFLNNDENENKVKKLVSDYYTILGDRSWERDVLSMESFYQYLSPKVFSNSTQEEKTVKEVSAEKPLTADILRQRYDDEYYSFTDVPEQFAAIKSLDDKTAMLDLVKYMYLDTLADAGIEFFLLAEKIRSDFGLSYKDFDKNELTKTVKIAYGKLNVASFYGLHFELYDDYVCWGCDYELSDYADEVEELFDYVGIKLALDNNNVVEILTRLDGADYLNYYIFSQIRESYPNVLSDSNILSNANLKKLVLKVVYDMIDTSFDYGMGDLIGANVNYEINKLTFSNGLDNYIYLFRDGVGLKTKLLERYKLLSVEPNRIVYDCDADCFRQIRENFVADYLYNVSDSEMEAVETEIYISNKDSVKNSIEAYLLGDSTYDRENAVEAIASIFNVVGERNVFANEVLSDLIEENKNDYAYYDNLLDLLIVLDGDDFENGWIQEFVNLLKE